MLLLHWRSTPVQEQLRVLQALAAVRLRRLLRLQHKRGRGWCCCDRSNTIAQPTRFARRKRRESSRAQGHLQSLLRLLPRSLCNDVVLARSRRRTTAHSVRLLPRSTDRRATALCVTDRRVTDTSSQRNSSRSSSTSRSRSSRDTGSGCGRTSTVLVLQAVVEVPSAIKFRP